MSATAMLRTTAWQREALDWSYRLAYRCGFPLARLYWRLRQPEHSGTQIAIWVDGRVLCVRQSYRARLSFPGGGVETGEHPEAAARRELREELGLVVEPALLQLAHCETGLWEGRRDTVWFYEMHLTEVPAITLDRREILSAEFVEPRTLAALPVSGPVAAYLRWLA